MNILNMYNWKHLLAGVGIATVIILSSAPLIWLDEINTGVSVDLCTSAHGKVESECKADKEHHCVWCVSRAVPGMCYDESSAHQLPPSIFKCDFGSEGLLEDKLDVS
jgi:hypothetical protein